MAGRAVTRAEQPAPARIPVRKTYKLYVGGQFPRSESGRSYIVRTPDGTPLANAVRSSKKDLRDAVRTALDLAVPELTLGFESDGFEYHGSRSAFEYDRDRDSDLTAQRWHVVRLSASFLEHSADEARRRIACIAHERARLLGVE